jgi:hypothetical protein
MAGMTSHTDNSQQGWQPIATAPTDGTEIILAILVAGKHWVHIGWYEPYDRFPWRFIDTFDLTPTGCCRYEDGDRIPANGATAESVTHWMPLPAPPAPGEGE